MEKHNILIIYTDQLKKSILSCYGGTDISTPNIDYIASNGAKSGNFFTPSAVCTPSRGCFMTGLYPHKHKAYRNGVSIHTNAVGFASVFLKTVMIQFMTESGIYQKWKYCCFFRKFLIR